MLHSLLQFSPEEMTYEDLLIELANLSEEQLKQDVAVYDNYEQEYHQLTVKLVFATDECQVLDVDHPIIVF
jgi:hypothetical protein